MKRKYLSRKAKVDGITFDSIKEAHRYVYLKKRQELGLISDLKLQVKFELIPIQREPSTLTKRGKEKKGKTIELPVTYIADFVYMENGNMVVEDTKGFKTKDYIIKRKLMLYVHGIRIKEI